MGTSTNDINMLDSDIIQNRAEWDNDKIGGHWITMTPARVSPSPFLDALFILVASPLITLIIIYSLLFLRSQLRRRRWRAPKSLIEKLPTRTYHSIYNEPISHGSPQVAPLTISARTPLLSAPSLAPISSDSYLPTVALSSESQDWKKRHHGDEEAQQDLPPSNYSAQKNRKEGREVRSDRNWCCGCTQLECVICLEKYADGISKVMSLPCGHDFHAKCM